MSTTAKAGAPTRPAKLSQGVDQTQAAAKPSEPEPEAEAEAQEQPVDKPDGYEVSGRHLIPVDASASPPPKADPALARDMQAQLQGQHLSGPGGRRAEAPRVTRGEGARAREKPSADQAAFVAQMKARGVEAGHPPTEAQLKAYFGSFNNKKDRPKALDAYAQYSSAYHVHPANTDRPNRDIKYSAESHYGVGKRIFKTEAEAQKAANKTRTPWVEYPTNDASSFDDVTKQRGKHEGRHVNDCEGFAYTAQELLGAAGYRAEQVATVDKDGGGIHAMTVLRAPGSKKAIVTSNGKVYQGKGRTQLLNDAYQEAGGTTPGRHFPGATQGEAQARMMLELGY